MDYSQSTKVNSFYTIVSGLLRFDDKHIDVQGLWDNFSIWRERINNGNYHSTFNYLNNSYYDGYLNNIFPEIRYSEEKLGVFHKDILNHLTSKKFLQEKSIVKVEINKEKHIESKIDYIDLFLFPHNICLFSIKFYIDSPNNQNLGSISDFTNRIRNLQCKIEFEENTISLQKFIESYVILHLKPPENWTVFNPQLKSYVVIDLTESLFEFELNNLLFDIGNMSPLGSAKGEGIFAPSKSFYEEQLNNNKISVFQNWSALSLFDTFTRISINFPDEYRSWEYDYFNIYIHCLYLKFFMYLTNTELSDLTSVTKRTEIIRDKFIEFINDNYHSHISYKFLPDLMQDKLLYSLEIPSEIEKMEIKIQRINEHIQEKRQKAFNKVLITMTLLNIVGVVFTLSEWFVNLGLPRSMVYPFISTAISAVVIGIIYYIIFGKKR
jgi:hypothetical protein